MRLLKAEDDGSLRLLEFFGSDIPQYAILSHTWGPDGDEVTYKDIERHPNTCVSKPGYAKIEFCARQAARDNLSYFWIDTCCIDKSSSAELSEAINSMFRWYQNSAICYVYLADVGSVEDDCTASFRKSRWFSRGWTLQELIAPRDVQFFSKDGTSLGSKDTLVQFLHDVTGIAEGALRGEPLLQFPVHERMAWARARETKREEDAVYSLLGLFDVSMPLIYGEGRLRAFSRLNREIGELSKPTSSASALPTLSGKDYDDFVSRLHDLIIQERDRVNAQLSTLPIYSPLLASIKNTIAYPNWVENGHTLYCSTEEVADPANKNTIAAMAMLDFAKSKGKAESPPNLWYYDGTTSNDDCSKGCGTTTTLGLSLVMYAMELRSKSRADLRTFLGTLSAGTLNELQIIFRERLFQGFKERDVPDFKPDPAEVFKKILDHIKLAGSTIIIAVDNSHLVKTFHQQLGPVRTALDSINDFVVASMELRFVVAGEPSPGLMGFTSGLTSLHTLTQKSECLECLRFLWVEEQNTRLSQVTTAQQMTNNWIWTHRSYLDWKTSRAGILWVEGKPGSGKSVLAKSVLAHINPSRKVYTCYWFFSKRGGQALTSHAFFIKSILYQLLLQDYSLFRHYRDTFRQYAPQSAAGWNSITAEYPWRFPAWESIPAMQGVLRNIVAAGSEVQCIIDAMDEAETVSNDTHTRRELLSTLSNLVADATLSHFKVIVFSRPSLDIDLELTRHHQKYGNLHRIVLQVENTDTISTIVDAGIESLRSAMDTWRADYHPSKLSNSGHGSPHGLKRIRLGYTLQDRQKKKQEIVLERIRSYLVDNAEGVILWVVLILDLLESTIKRGMYTTLELETRLKTLPTELDGLYSYIVKELQSRFGDQELSKSRIALMLISAGESTLELQELWDALATPEDVDSAHGCDEDPIDQRRVHISSWKEFRRHIYEMCGPLVEVLTPKPPKNASSGDDDDISPESTVQLLHQTVKDFLADPKLAGPLFFTRDESFVCWYRTLNAYSSVVFPHRPTEYAHLPMLEGCAWTQNVESTAAYFSDKRLLPRLLRSTGTCDLRKILGIFGSFMVDFTCPPLHTWQVVELEAEFGSGLSTMASLDHAQGKAAAHFASFVCENGLHIGAHILCRILMWENNPYLWCAVFDAALLVAIRYEMQDLVEKLTELGPDEPEHRFWEEEEHVFLGKSMFLTPFEIAAAWTGNLQILLTVYDRNTVVNKPFPWDEWDHLSQGRQCWRRTREEWDVLQEFTEKCRLERGEPEPVLNHIQRAIDVIAVFK